MIELDPITVSEYVNLDPKEQEPYNFALMFVKRFNTPVDEFKVGDVMDLSFGFVKDLQYEMERGISWQKLVDFVLEATKLENVADIPLDKFSRFANYLKKSVQTILDVEEQTLAYDPTDSEQSAGMDRFKNLGIYLQIRKLTGGDVTKYDAVRALPYSLCFTELYTSKQLHDYEQELRKRK